MSRLSINDYVFGRKADMRVVSGQVLYISTHGVTAINITHFGAGKKRAGWEPALSSNADA